MYFEPFFFAAGFAFFTEVPLTGAFEAVVLPFLEMLTAWVPDFAALRDPEALFRW